MKRSPSLLSLVLVVACAEPSAEHGGATTSESSSTSDGTTAIATSSSSESSGDVDTSSSTTGGCVPGFEVGDFTQISELAIGTTERYDMDRDGRLDVVGGRGVVVSADLDVAVVVADAPGDDGHPGIFDGDDLPDMAWALPDEGFAVYPASGGDPIISATLDSPSFAARDIDGDGIDDIAIAKTNGTSVWRGTANGSFTKLADIGSNTTVHPAFFQQPDGIYLAVPDKYSLAVKVYRYDAGAFTVASTFILLAAQSLDPVDAFADGSEYLLAMQSATQPTTSSSVELLYAQDDAWDSWSVAFDGHKARSAALGDVDGDGIGEIAVAFDDHSLTLLCWTGDGFSRCGTNAGLPGAQVELLPDLVVSAGDGVWTAALTPTVCP